MTMLVTKMRSPYGIVEMNGDQVTSFREKPVLEHYINSGLYYIKNSIKEIFFRSSLEWIAEGITLILASPFATVGKTIGDAKTPSFL